MSRSCDPEGQIHVQTVKGSRDQFGWGENPPSVLASWPVLLIVDDEPLGLKAMASVFEGQGYEMVLAGSGPEAMQFVETGRPDVILLDVMMPGMDGLETCRRIRLHPGMAEIPILLVTALDDRQSRLEGLESGADDYITKPIDRAEVRARCERSHGSIDSGGCRKRSPTRDRRWQSCVNTRAAWICCARSTGRS